MKKVSVIIPAYNKAEYTRRTVESILAQTYSNIEILVVDDGSKDNTAAIMAGYKDHIRFIEKANGGACSARNEGIRKATGECVAFLDCDDLYCREKIEKCVNYLETNPHFGFVYTGAYFIDEHDAVVGQYDHPCSKEGHIATDLVLGNFICNSTVVVKKTILDKVGLFDETIFPPADWDLWLRLSQVSQAGYLREPLTKYRIVDNYIFNRLEQARREEIYVLEKFFKSSADCGVLKNRAFSNFYLRFAQSAFISGDRQKFWTDCKQCFNIHPWNIKLYAIVLAALLMPQKLQKELERKILRGKA